MTTAVPKFDERSAREIYRDVETLLPASLRPGHDPRGRLDAALMQVFARFGEIIIHRLNQAPGKNLLAFLDLVGVSPLPMQAAWVPLTFSMAPGSASCAVVPAGTQVAAPPGQSQPDKLQPGDGQPKPVIFETLQQLVVTTAKLDSLLMKFGTRDQYKDLSLALLLPSDSQMAGAGDAQVIAPAVQSIPHQLYIAVPVNPTWPHIDQLRLRFALDQGGAQIADSRSLQWEMRTVDDPTQSAANVGIPAASDASPAIIVVPQEDGTKNLTQAGDIVFANLPQTPTVAVNGIRGRWLCCRLLSPMTSSPEPVAGMVRGSQVPAVKEVSAEIRLARNDLAVEQAFYNGQKVDVTKDFFPFGERPKFSDTLYLANRESFSNPGAKVTLRIELTNPESAGPDVGIPNTATRNTQLCWEFWNGQAWTSLGKTGRYLRVDDAAGDAEFTDETKSLSTNGNVSFRFSSPPVELNLNGQKNYWVRVRIVAGDYGRELQYRKDPASGALVTTGATLAPPSIRSIKIDYVVKKETKPPAVLTCNDFVFVQASSQSGSFKPFTPVAPDEIPPAIYFGFAADSLPAGNRPTNSAVVPTQSKERLRKIPNQPVSVYLVFENSHSQKSGEAGRVAVAIWEYWNGSAWNKLAVRDETQSLRRSGLIQFLAPTDFASKNEFGRQRFWLRMRPNADDFDPTIRNVYLNTTTAIQGATVVNDVLGSSNGKPDQKFRTVQVMVLPGQKLEVCEPTMPALNECRSIEAYEGDGAIQTVTARVGRGNQFWVTWHEVPNFYGSGPRDRHYVLDHLSGEVIFGDGLSGMIPPILPGNIRMTRYRSGGGVAGNLAAQAIKQLISAVPYVQKVVNWIPASGGTDPEASANLIDRGPRGIRHGHRAVTREDFEDLAMLASREVARAKCVPQCDLSLDPDAKRRRPGVISLIVVPHSSDSRPVPDPDLFDRVRAFVDDWRLPTAEIVLVGPEYVRVDVSAEIVVNQPGDASDVELAAKRALERYLHPVSGGLDGNGWEFGRLPLKFDLCGLIEQIPGVSHVRDIRTSAIADRPGAEKTDQFLICCGQHQISMTLEEQECR